MLYISASFLLFLQCHHFSFALIPWLLGSLSVVPAPCSEGAQKHRVCHQSYYVVLSHSRVWKGLRSFISLIIINNKTLGFEGLNTRWLMAAWTPCAILVCGGWILEAGRLHQNHRNKNVRLPYMKIINKNYRGTLPPALCSDLWFSKAVLHVLITSVWQYLSSLWPLVCVCVCHALQSWVEWPSLGRVTPSLHDDVVKTSVGKPWSSLTAQFAGW